jgi:predicted tellurium resistance membrane protein TerC
MLEQLLITSQILIIDVVMAADNAIIIGLIAANYAPDNRKKIIAWGVGAAFVFRIFLQLGQIIYSSLHGLKY